MSNTMKDFVSKAAESLSGSGLNAAIIYVEADASTNGAGSEDTESLRDYTTELEGTNATLRQQVEDLTRRAEVAAAAVSRLAPSDDEPSEQPGDVDHDEFPLSCLGLKDATAERAAKAGYATVGALRADYMGGDIRSTKLTKDHLIEIGEKLLGLAPAARPVAVADAGSHDDDPDSNIDDGAPEGLEVPTWDDRLEIAQIKEEAYHAAVTADDPTAAQEALCYLRSLLWSLGLPIQNDAGESLSVDESLEAAGVELVEVDGGEAGE